MFANCIVIKAQQSTTIDQKLLRTPLPVTTELRLWRPQPRGVSGGWGPRLGPGSRGRGPAPILLWSRYNDREIIGL